MLPQVPAGGIRFTPSIGKSIDAAPGAKPKPSRIITTTSSASGDLRACVVEDGVRVESGTL